MGYYIVMVPRPTSFATEEGEIMLSRGNPHRITEKQYEEIIKTQSKKAESCIFTYYPDPDDTKAVPELEAHPDSEHFHDADSYSTGTAEMETKKVDEEISTEKKPKKKSRKKKKVE